MVSSGFRFGSAAKGDSGRNGGGNNGTLILTLRRNNVPDVGEAAAERTASPRHHSALPLKIGQENLVRSDLHAGGPRFCRHPDASHGS